MTASGLGDKRACVPAESGGVQPAPASIASALSPVRLLPLYRTLATAREIDRVELDLVRRGLAFFHVSGAGHEATACLAGHLRPSDWLHVHYRDKALLLARGLPVDEFFASLLCRAGSHSEGRQMSAHFSCPRLHLLSQTGPVGNHALQAVGVAAALEDGLPSPSSQIKHGLGRPSSDGADHPIVVCATGDGGTQQGQFLEAIAEAVRSRLPVLFLIEDNHLAISTRTAGKTFWDLPRHLAKVPGVAELVRVPGVDQPDSQTSHEACYRPAEEFYGLPILRVDGADVPAADRVFGEVVSCMRAERSPAIVVLDVDRLADHSNADDQDQYRDPAEVAHAVATRDPIRRLESYLLENGHCAADLEDIHRAVVAEVESAAARALALPEPTACHTAKMPLPAAMTERAEYTGTCGTAAPGCTALPLPPGEGKLTMREALNGVLRHRLATDERVFLYGQDIEDPKGDVFGVTRGLSTAFPGRVVNSPLSESTIIGTSIGRALAGQRPVAFIQFADFLPLAYNQIASELASMYWRTAGDRTLPLPPGEGTGWQCPVIVMITCGGYKPGLGPFHSQTLESIACHTPGIDVVMPSTAGDAAGLLNAAFESGRPTLFFYPKSCLNLAHRGTSADIERHFVPLGRARRISISVGNALCGVPSRAEGSSIGIGSPTDEASVGNGLRAVPPRTEGLSSANSRNGTESVPYSTNRTNPSLTLVTWGNTIDQCQRAAAALAGAGIVTDIFDLRSLSPWDEPTVIASVERTGRLVIVHEDNHTCGFGAEVAATVAEKAAVPIKIRRVTRPDTFVPCHFGNQLEILPSFKRVLETCAELLDFDVEWLPETDEPTDIGVIRVLPSGPADDRVDVLEIKVAIGDEITAGQVVAVIEAAKSVGDVLSDHSGTIIEILASPGDRVAVGQPLVRVRLPPRSVSVSLAHDSRTFRCAHVYTRWTPSALCGW